MGDREGIKGPAEEEQQKKKRSHNSIIDHRERKKRKIQVMSEVKVDNEVVILGSGPAGLTAALYCARAQLKPLVFHGDMPGGQLTTTTVIENFPGFPQGIDGNELVQNIQKQAESFGALVKYGICTKIEKIGDDSGFKLTCGDETVTTRCVIVATGASPRKLGLPSEEKYWSKGVTSCATCDGFFFKKMDVCVIGGGDSAMEEATFLTRFCSKVYIIHRRDALRASKIMAKRVLDHDKIEVVWNSVPEEILGDDKNVTGIRLKDVKTGEKKDLPLKGVFLGIGHKPNTVGLVPFLEADENGYIKTEPDGTATSVPGIFACGDCQDHVFRQAVTAAGSGCSAAIQAERWLEASN